MCLLNKRCKIYYNNQIKGGHILEKLDYLIEYLLNENKNVKITKIPYDEISKKKLYRSLCNIRDPLPISKEYLKIENEYLQEELEKKNITQIEEIKTINELFPQTNLKHKSKICLWKGDITTLKIETIVNAANSQGLGCFLALHNCIDNQVNSNAGISLRLECNEIMKLKNYHLETSEAIITNGHNLPCKYIIHTVGPIIYENVTEKEILELKKCYINSLELAKENNIKTIAFPCISTGEFRFPKELASKIAVETVKEYLKTNEGYFEKIVFDVFEDSDYRSYFKYLGEEYGKEL